MDVSASTALSRPEPRVSRAELDEPELVRRAAAGDDHAFRALVAGVLPRLRRWALVRTGDPDDADEVVQRTLIALHRSLPRLRERAALSGWLYRVMTNAATDLARERTTVRREPAPRGELAAQPEPAASPEPLRGVHAGRMAEVVRAFTELLPPRQRELLELVDHEGMAPAEAAALLGLKPVSARASLFKARRALRSRVLQRFPELVEGYEP